MAEARYSVTVKFGIGLYEGEWTGEEERMEEQYTILCVSPSRRYAELLYKELIAGREFFRDCILHARYGVYCRICEFSDSSRTQVS